MLLKKAKAENAYFKFGGYGKAGSGKTFTASKIAIGLHQYIKAKKPVGFIDSEGGSDFVLPLFDNAKVDLLVEKTRSFKDLLTVMDEAVKECSILIIDNEWHFWNELIKSYLKKYNLTALRGPQRIGEVKQTWFEFTENYVTSPIHILMVGREGQLWQYIEDDEGVKELQATGTKMRGETDIGYEPNLLCEFEQVRKSSTPGSQWIHRCWVIKDRFDILDGRFFDNPGFESFLPHIEALNLGGKHRPVDTTRESTGIFKDRNVGIAKIKLRDSLLEKIQNEFYLLYPGRDDKSKVERLKLMEQVFGTNAWKELEEMRNEVLQKGYDRVKETRRQKSAPTIEPGTNEAKS